MSQEKVYKILQELGGMATTGEISRVAKQKYPTANLYHYVSTRLGQLEKFHIVERIKTKEGFKWKILRKF